MATRHTGPRGAAPPAVAWPVWSFLGATVVLLLAGAGILLGGLLNPAVTGFVTMPERWDGTTALEEVP